MNKARHRITSVLLRRSSVKTSALPLKEVVTRLYTQQVLIVERFFRQNAKKTIETKEISLLQKSQRRPVQLRRYPGQGVSNRRNLVPDPER
jgi:hypothetical protein